MSFEVDTAFLFGNVANRARPATQNIVVLLFIGGMLLWAFLAARLIFISFEILNILAEKEAVRFDGMGAFTDDLESILRSHINQILRMKTEVPPIAVAKWVVDAWVRPESVKISPRASSSMDTGETSEVNLSFEFVSNTRCSVELLWGVPTNFIDSWLGSVVSGKTRYEVSSSTADTLYSLCPSFPFWSAGNSRRTNPLSAGLLESSPSSHLPTAPALPPPSITGDTQPDASGLQQSSSAAQRVDPHPAHRPSFVRKLFGGLLQRSPSLAATTVTPTRLRNELESVVESRLGVPLANTRRRGPAVRSTVGLRCLAKSPPVRYHAPTTSGPITFADTFDSSSTSPLASVFAVPLASDAVLSVQGRSSDAALTTGGSTSLMDQLSPTIGDMFDWIARRFRRTPQQPPQDSGDSATSNTAEAGSDISTSESQHVAETPDRPPVQHETISLVIVIQTFRELGTLPESLRSDPKSWDNSTASAGSAHGQDSLSFTLAPVVMCDTHLTLVRFRGPNSLEVVKQAVVAPSGVVETAEVYGLEDPNERECLVCMGELKNTVVLPCRHCSSCQDCLRSLLQEKCPICRSSFTSYLSLPYSYTRRPAN